MDHVRTQQKATAKKATRQKADEVSRGMRRAARELEARRELAAVEMQHAAREMKARKPRVRMRSVAMPTFTVPVLESPRRSRFGRRRRGAGRSLRPVFITALVGVIAAVVVRAQRRAAGAPMLSGEDMGLEGRPAAAPKDGPAHQMAPMPGEGRPVRR
jgi:hypothetical protein